LANGGERKFAIKNYPEPDSGPGYLNQEGRDRRRRDWKGVT